MYLGGTTIESPLNNKHEQGGSLALRVANEVTYEKIINCIGQWAQAMYISLAMMALMPFYCYTHPGRDYQSLVK